MRRLCSFLILLLGHPFILRAEADPQPEPKRGVWPALKRTWHATLNGAESAVNATGSAVQSASQSVVGVFSPNHSKSAPKSPLEISVACTPFPIVLSKVQKVRVLLKVFNSGKRTQLLEFASSQRADAVLRDASGQIVARAVPEFPIRTESSLVTVNPGERLEYAVLLPTTGLVPGKNYTLECALLGQAGLVARLQVAPM
jgi:hypothetical protein